MISSEETLLNAVDEVSDAFEEMLNSNEHIAQRDFAIESPAWFFQLHQHLFQSLINVVSYDRLHGPFPDGFYIVRVYLSLDLHEKLQKKEKSSLFNCVDVRQSRSSHSAHLQSDLLCQDDASDYISSSELDEHVETSEEQKWQFNLPAQCTSSDKLKKLLHLDTQKLDQFYICNQGGRYSRIYGRHEDVRGKRRCIGSFIYKMQKDGVYCLTRSTEHTCSRK